MTAEELDFFFPSLRVLYSHWLRGGVCRLISDILHARYLEYLGGVRDTSASLLSRVFERFTRTVPAPCRHRLTGELVKPVGGLEIRAKG